MSNQSVAEIAAMFARDDKSQWVGSLWNTYHTQRAGKVAEWLELRNYVFATDTTSTSNSSLPWKNTTTRPKLCQIRDNLHANYKSHLFPNDNWLKWQAYTADAASKKKAKAIESYMENKCREGHFRTEMSKLLYDYIDYGNAFATVSFEARHKTLTDGTEVPGFIGPKVHRISPMDIIFDPLASDFSDSFKVIRSIKTLGELKRLAATHPEQSFWADAVERREKLREALSSYSKEDFEKAIAFDVDGFGNLYEYYQSNYVEVLEFYGDYHNSETGELEINKVITVVDRSYTVRDVTSENWEDHAPIFHVGWRLRQDNLWAMGPLDNLVGLQYRIDHLENLKSDAMDLCVHPPLVITGEVEEFEWGPGAEIHVDENGGVSELGKNLNGIMAAAADIRELAQEMEELAGAPKQAMGIRTPGEKTATEVNQLQNAAGRIFQEKITHFEVELLERILNAMLETSARNLSGSDVIRVFDNDLGVQEFKSITRSDITASGKIRPVGARHFGQQAQDLQNIIGIMNSPIGGMVAPHMSGKALAEFVKDVTGLRGYEIFKSNVAISEQRETQALANQAQEDLDAESGLPIEDDA